MKGKRYKQLLTEIESEKDLSKKRKPTTWLQKRYKTQKWYSDEADLIHNFCLEMKRPIPVPKFWGGKGKWNAKPKLGLGPRLFVVKLFPRNGMKRECA